MSTSDIESIMSEDIEVASDAGSEEYNPQSYEDDYDDEEFNDFNAKPHLKSGFVKAAQLKPVANVPRSTIDVPTALKSNDDQTDYTNSFEDDFEPESVSGGDDDEVGYSNDFESSEMQSLHRSRSASTPISSIKDRANAQIHKLPATPNTLTLPSIDLHAAQAELALDEISKEVLRLRNRQKSLLQARRQVAKEKKQRAEGRRLIYQMEFKKAKDQVEQYKRIESELRDEIRLLAMKLSESEESRSLLQTTLTLAEKQIETSNDNITLLRARIQSQDEQFLNAQEQARVQDEQWKLQSTKLRAELQRAELMACVLQKSTEASEARILRERDSLPQHHQQVLNESLERVAMRESVLQEREGQLRAEESRRLAAVEQLRKEIVDELTQSRHRLDQDLADGRANFQAKVADFEAERARHTAHVAHEAAATAANRVALQQEEARLRDEKMELQRQRTELEVGQRLVQPGLQAAERDREDARLARVRGEAALTEVDEKAALVLGAERRVLQREREVEEREAVAAGWEKSIGDDRRIVALEAARLQSDRQAIDSERFQLHIAALEMTKQVSEIKLAIQQLLQRSLGSKILTSGGSNDSPTFSSRANGVARRGSGEGASRVSECDKLYGRDQEGRGMEYHRRSTEDLQRDGGKENDSEKRDQYGRSKGLVGRGGGGDGAWHLDSSIIKTMYSLDSVAAALEGMAESLQPRQHAHIMNSDRPLMHAAMSIPENFPYSSPSGHPSSYLLKPAAQRNDMLSSIALHGEKMFKSHDQPRIGFKYAERSVLVDGSRKSTALLPREELDDAEGSLEQVRLSAQAIRSAAVKYGIL